MGIRSDVFVAIQTDLAAKMPPTIRKWMGTYADRHGTHAEGEYFYFENVKWYTDDDPDIRALYEWLIATDATGGSEYKILEACHDYPCSEDAEAGDWDDNPWNASRNVSVSIDFEEPEE